MKEKDIRYVLKIAELQNFTKAAEALYIAQPALSRHIRQLETSLGFSIFDRNTTPISLTSFGEIYISYAKQINQLNTEFLREIELLKNTQRLKIRLGIPLQSGDYFAHMLLPYLYRNHPEIKAEISVGYTNQLISDLLSGKFDVIICGKQFSQNGYSVKKIKDEKGLIITSKKSELSRKSNCSNLSEELLEDQVFVYSPHAILHDKVHTILNKNNLKLEQELEVPNMQIAFSIVESGLGFTCILENMLKNRTLQVNFDNINSFSLEDLIFPIYIAYNQHQYESCHALKIIIDYLRNLNQKGES